MKLSPKSRSLVLLLSICLMMFSVSATVWADDNPIILAPSEQSLFSEIEVNQGLGQKLLEGEYVPATDFVAGKDTVVRVYLNQMVDVDTKNKSQTLEIYRDGELITTLLPSPAEGPADHLTFKPRKRSDVGEWKAGNYTFVAKVNDQSLTRENVEFMLRRTLQVLAVPIRANYGGEIKTPIEVWKKGDDFMRKIFPLANDGLIWELGKEFDGSGPEYDLTTEDGRRGIWQGLNNLQPRGNAKKYDLIVGFIASQIPLGEFALQGYTYGAPSNIVVAEDEDMMATVAHEVAHVYGIGDEYIGGTLRFGVNPPPDGYTGTDWDTREQTTITGSLAKLAPTELGDGSLITAVDDRPYDVSGRGPLPDSKSFMGTGGKQENNWMTSAIWTHLFQQFQPAMPVAGDAEPSRMIEVWGWITRATGEVDLALPWYTYVTPTRLAKESGTYTIQAVDASGKVLDKQGFTPSFIVESPPRVMDEAPFNLVVPFPYGTTKFLILSGSTVVGEVPVSANEPGVSLVAELSGKQLIGTQTIEWQGEDKDGDTLYYDVEYTADGEDWWYLAAEIEETEWTGDFDQLPGGGNAQIRITVSDGIYNTVAVSDPFQVPVKAPEIYIDSPVDSETLAYEEEVNLYAEVYDLQDEWITDEKALTWSSDVDGELGEGEWLVGQLSPGKHVITLVATNSKGLSSQASVTVTIQEPVTIESSEPAPHPVAPPTPEDGIRIMVNNQLLRLDVKPVQIGGRTLVPLRAIFEALGLTVGYDSATGMVTGSRQELTISLKIGDNQAKINSQAKSLDVPASTVEGRTMVPVRFVAESTGAVVGWDAPNNMVTIQTAP